MILRLTFSALLALSLIVTALGSSADERGELRKIFEEDRSAAEAIALYPPETRHQVLEATLYPEIIVRLKGLQRETRASFLTLIEPLDRDEQATIYELVRYPGLITELGSRDSKPRSAQLDSILTNYPDSVHDEARSAVKDSFRILRQVSALNIGARESVDRFLAEYSQQVRKSFESLLETPEVLEILADNLETTILAGNLYRREPAWLRNRLDALNLEVARRQAEELKDYKERIASDPEAFKEMQQAADLYLEENNVATAEKTTVVYAYPYWFGYPHWHSHALWRPYPYHYHTGFYVSPAGTVVIVGLPSYHYVHWHTTYYPHLHLRLYAHYHQHYLRHPHGHGGFYASVDVDIHRNTRIKIDRDVDINRDVDREKRSNKDPDINAKRQKFKVQEDRSMERDRFKAQDNHRGAWQAWGNQTGHRSPGKLRSNRGG